MPTPKARISQYFACLLALGTCTAPVPAALNINIEAIQKSVVFLYGSDAAGKVDVQKAVGTGFLVNVPVISEPTKSYYLVVTARHIFDPEWAKCDERNPTIIYARLN